MKQLWLIGGLVAVGACGGGGSYGSPSEAFRAAIQAQCELAHDCEASYDPAQHNDQAFAASYGASASECYDQTIALLNQFAPTYFDDADAAADRGTVVFNGDDAGACVEQSSAQSCDQFFEQNGAMFNEPAVCDTALQGTVAAGGACEIDEECAAGECIDAVCVVE